MSAHVRHVTIAVVIVIALLIVATVAAKILL